MLRTKGTAIAICRCLQFLRKKAIIVRRAQATHQLIIVKVPAKGRSPVGNISQINTNPEAEVS